MVELFYIAKKIEVFGKIGEPFQLESKEIAQKVFKLLKKKQDFKINNDTIWRIKHSPKKKL